MGRISIVLVALLVFIGVLTPAANASPVAPQALGNVGLAASQAPANAAALPDGYRCANWPPVASATGGAPATRDAQRAAGEQCGTTYDDQKSDRCEWIASPPGWRCLISNTNNGNPPADGRPPLPDGYRCANWPPVASATVGAPATRDAQRAAGEQCGTTYDDQKSDRCEWIASPPGWRCLISNTNNGKPPANKDDLDETIEALIAAAAAAAAAANDIPNRGIPIGPDGPPPIPRPSPTMGGSIRGDVDNPKADGRSISGRTLTPGPNSQLQIDVASVLYEKALVSPAVAGTSPRTSVVILVDESGSMGDGQCGFRGPNRINCAKEAIIDILDEMDRSSHRYSVAIVGFSGSARTYTNGFESASSAARDVSRIRLNNGDESFSAAFSRATQLLSGRSGRKQIILFTDAVIEPESTQIHYTREVERLVDRLDDDGVIIDSFKVTGLYCAPIFDITEQVIENGGDCRTLRDTNPRLPSPGAPRTEGSDAEYKFVPVNQHPVRLTLKDSSTGKSWYWQEVLPQPSSRTGVAFSAEFNIGLEFSGPGEYTVSNGVQARSGTFNVNRPRLVHPDGYEYEIDQDGLLQIIVEDSTTVACTTCPGLSANGVVLPGLTYVAANDRAGAKIEVKYNISQSRIFESIDQAFENAFKFWLTAIGVVLTGQMLIVDQLSAPVEAEDRSISRFTVRNSNSDLRVLHYRGMPIAFIADGETRTGQTIGVNLTADGRVGSFDDALSAPAGTGEDLEERIFDWASAHGQYLEDDDREAVVDRCYELLSENLCDTTPVFFSGNGVQTEVSRHIDWAQTNGYPMVLNFKNREASRPVWHRAFPDSICNPQRAGYQCDEYPFWSSQQGYHANRGDRSPSLRLVSQGANASHGASYGWFLYGCDLATPSVAPPEFIVLPVHDLIPREMPSFWVC